MAALFRMGLREPVIACNETWEKERERFEYNFVVMRGPRIIRIEYFVSKKRTSSKISYGLAGILGRAIIL